MIKDSKYIIRKVIIGVLITLILSFISSCEAHAKTYQYVNDGSSVGLYPSGSNSINFNQWYEPNSNQALQTINLYLQSVEKAENDSTLYNGVYLIDFYIVTSGLNDNLADCSGFRSDYRFIDLTSGNIISSANNIKSECVNSYYTRYNNSRAIHYLVQFKIDSTGYSYDLTTRELRFINKNYNGSGFVNYGVAYNVVYGGIYDYSSDIVTTFEQYAQNAKTNQSLDEMNNNIRNQISNDNTNTNSIINNNNQNTQNIINNQNTNSQNEINNANTNSQNEINNANTNSQNEINAANQNTDKEIESQKSCKKVDNTTIEIKNSLLKSNGKVSSHNSYGVTKYFNIENSTIKVIRETESDFNAYYCFYNGNKTLIECKKIENLAEASELTIPNDAVYFRSSIFVPTQASYRPSFEICKNGNQAINDSINETNDTLKDDSVDDPDKYFDEFDDLMADNGVITDLITLPISLYTKILNNINGTCSPFNLGKLLGTDLQFGCINIGDLIGSTLWNIIDIIVSGMFVLIIAKRMIKVFENMTSMKESDDLE